MAIITDNPYKEFDAEITAITKKLRLEVEKTLKDSLEACLEKHDIQGKVSVKVTFMTEIDHQS